MHSDFWCGIRDANPKNSVFTGIAWFELFKCCTAIMCTLYIQSLLGEYVRVCRRL